jgi:hypothetical protein
VSDLGPRLSPRARERRRAISVAAVLFALLVVFAGLPALRQDAFALLIAPTPTPPPTPVVAEPTFLTIQIAVILSAPAHAGDAVTLVILPQPAFDVHDPQRSYFVTTTSMLYGPFASAAALQDAVASSTDGPPSGPGLPLPGGHFGTTLTAVGFSDLASTFNLPRTLSPGFYDFVVIVTLRGSRATARTDVPLQIVAGG